MASRTSPLPTPGWLKQPDDIARGWRGQFRRCNQLRHQAMLVLSVAVGDFNGDDKQDLAVANQSSNNVSVLLGDGAGSFSSATNFGVGSASFFSGGGRFQRGKAEQDLATANQISPTTCRCYWAMARAVSSTSTNFNVGTRTPGQAWSAISTAMASKTSLLAILGYQQRVDLVTRLPGESNHSRGNDLQPVLVRHRSDPWQRCNTTSYGGVIHTVGPRNLLY